MTDRQTLLSGYQQCPELLAMELEVLFEPCTDASFAVLHNKAVDLIRVLCGDRQVEKDDIGIVTRDSFDLGPKKRKLADRLARSVLIYAHGVQE